MIKLFGFLLLFLLPLFAFAECETSKHHIFLLHGIGGSKKTFGSLEAILEKQNPCQMAHTFEYQTGSLLTPSDFARHFHEFVTTYPQVQDGDKISLIMHSQGGLVGSLWLKHLVEVNHSYLKQMDAFITLSTPFWGTDIAHVGKLLFYTLPDGVINPISPFGRNELNEMTYGSGSILSFVQDLDATLSAIPQMRTLFIAGMKRLYNSRLGEDDIVVPVHSMQPSHYYLKDEFNLRDKNRIPASFFEKGPERPFKIVSADHIKLDQYGIADLPSKCLKDMNCDHPSLLPILNHLKEKKLETDKEYKLTRFRFTMYITNPELIQYEQKKLRLKVHGFDQHTKVPKIERLNPFLGTAELEKGLAFSFGGFLKTPGIHKVQVTLEYKGSPLKTYEVPLEAGHSTFIEASLIRSLNESVEFNLPHADSK